MSALMELDAPRLQAAYDREPARVSHDLLEHPLLELDELARLAKRLPPGSVRHNLADVPAVIPRSELRQLALPVDELARTIADNNCWMVLPHIEHDPAYGELLAQVLEAARPMIPADERVTRREGFVFLSAPDAVTPAHVDPEHNFLLQIRGTKTMHVGRFPGAEQRALTLERFYAGKDGNIPFLPEGSQAVELSPGDGIYVPVGAPHWVKNGGETSISLSVTFWTDEAERRARVWRVNHQLRRIGLRPSAVGARPATDALKDAAYRRGQDALRIAERVAASRRREATV